MSSLPIFANENIKINKVRGVYFLFDDDELVYIGQSENILSRIASHLNDKRFDSYNFIECQYGNLDALEAKYILKYNPKYNKTLPCGGEWLSKSAIKTKFGIDKFTQNRIIKKCNIECIIFRGVVYVNAEQILKRI